jgi:hypothetical protein
MAITTVAKVMGIDDNDDGDNADDSWQWLMERRRRLLPT